MGTIYIAQTSIQDAILCLDVTRQCNVSIEISTLPHGCPSFGFPYCNKSWSIDSKELEVKFREQVLKGINNKNNINLLHFTYLL